MQIKIEEGFDLTELLGIKKWEPPESGAVRAGNARGNFPHFLQKTDQERAQNIGRSISQSFENGEEFEVTHKRDGSSITVYYLDGEVGVCSRNLELKIEDNEGDFVRTATELGLLDALKSLQMNIAVQGELVGPGVNGNRGKFSKHDIHVFDIWDIDARKHLLPGERMVVFNLLVEHGFKGGHVPVIHEAFKLPTDNVRELLKLAEQKDDKGLLIEGWVYKSRTRNFSFKTISDLYLIGFSL